MIQIPPAINVTSDPDTAQVVGVIEVNVTGKPELAVADNVVVAVANCGGIAAKLIVCSVLPVPLPVKAMVWVAYPGEGAFCVSSTMLIAPFSAPPSLGVKLRDRVHD